MIEMTLEVNKSVVYLRQPILQAYSTGQRPVDRLTLNARFWQYREHRSECDRPYHLKQR